MRLPLVIPFESRNGTSDKDSRLTNVLAETDLSGKIIAQSRPGLKIIKTGTGAAGGMVSYEGRLIAVVGTEAQEISVSEATFSYNFPFETDLLDLEGNAFSVLYDYPYPVISSDQILFGSGSAKFHDAHSAIEGVNVGAVMYSTDATPFNLLLTEFVLEFSVYSTSGGSFTLRSDSPSATPGESDVITFVVNFNSNSAWFRVQNFGFPLVNAEDLLNPDIDYGKWMTFKAQRVGDFFQLLLDDVLIGSYDATGDDIELKGTTGAEVTIGFGGVDEPATGYLSHFTLATAGEATVTLSTVEPGFYDFAQGTT